MYAEWPTSGDVVNWFLAGFLATLSWSSRHRQHTFVFWFSYDTCWVFGFFCLSACLFWESYVLQAVLEFVAEFNLLILLPLPPAFPSFRHVPLCLFYSCFHFHLSVYCVHEWWWWMARRQPAGPGTPTPGILLLPSEPFHWSKTLVFLFKRAFLSVDQAGFELRPSCLSLLSIGGVHHHTMPS